MAFITFSCQKNTEEVEPNLRPILANDPTQSFLKTLTSDPPADYYISGEFDGLSLNFTTTYSDDDPSYNAIYLDSALNLDNMHLVRENKDRAARIAIYFSYTKMFSQPLPYQLPHSNLAYCESAELQLINFANMGTVDQGSADDNFTFLGHSNTGITVKVTSLMNHIIEGTFEGQLKTKTGSSIMAKNGKFRLKLEEVKIK